MSDLESELSVTGRDSALARCAVRSKALPAIEEDGDDVEVRVLVFARGLVLARDSVALVLGDGRVLVGELL